MCLLTSSTNLNLKQHGSIWAYQGSRRQVTPESGTDNSTVTVWTGNLAPNTTELGSILLGLGLVYVGQPLSKVPVHLLGGVHSLDLKKRCAWVLV